MTVIALIIVYIVAVSGITSAAISIIVARAICRNHIEKIKENKKS